MATSRPDPDTWEWTGRRYRYVGGTALGGRKHVVYVSDRMVCQFEMDRDGIARVAVGSELKDAVHHLVERKAMPFAVAISPIGRTRDYVSSWRAVDTHVVIAGMRRVACRLFNGSAHAAAVEWVSRRGNGHGYHVLGHTLAYLNSTSPAGLEAAARKAAFDPARHPRGARGRFVATGSPAALRRRAAAAARRRGSR